MTLRDEMNSVAQEIIAAYDVRAEHVGQIREGAAQLRRAAQSELGKFHETRREMSRHLHAELAQGRTQLTGHFAQLRSDISTQLGGMHAQRQALHQTLAEGQAAWGEMASTMRQRRAGGTPSAPEAAVTPRRRGRKH